MKISFKSFSLAIIASALTLLGSACGGSSDSSSSDSDNSKKDLNQILEDKDFVAANEYLVQCFDECHRFGTAVSLEDDYVMPASKVLKAEATHLMDTDDPEAEKIFLLCLNDVAGNVGNWQVETGTFDGVDKFDNRQYIEEVTPYNACLLAIIREALIKDKLPLAKKIYKMMKPNYIESKELKEGEDPGYVKSYIRTYKSNDAQREEAKTLIADYEAEQN